MKYNQIKPRSKVTILIPNGIGRNGLEWKEKIVTVVMKGQYGWVANGGGNHGKPYVITQDNFVR